ncbi:putative BEL1-like homeodomain 8 [Hibiscus syriacus]|uniref:BEL1-like homeodomain 8 n=1 Tax=Hibiscus syriacus TaxID=106335 RepID=A0A6A2ZXE0_HIBSY|nr:putative BEL1-like homeodomain 8 [Hibiscus syriacus]
MGRMKLLGLALAILMMVSCCLAANRKVIKVEEEVKHERTLLDNGGTIRVGYPSSGVDNHHRLPRQDFNNYPGGSGSGDGSW